MKIICNECQYEFSDKAERCPRCGAPNQAYIEILSSLSEMEELTRKISSRIKVLVAACIVSFVMCFIVAENVELWFRFVMFFMTLPFMSFIAIFLKFYVVRWGLIRGCIFAFIALAILGFLFATITKSLPDTLGNIIGIILGIAYFGWYVVYIFKPIIDYVKIKKLEKGIENKQ